MGLFVQIAGVGSSILNTATQLLMVVMIASVSQIKALSPEQTCPLVKNNTYIGDPNDCQGWVLCTGGKAIYGKCTENLYFDSATGVCDYQENVSCNLNVETMCAGLTDMYKADPNDCSKYCYCKDGATQCNKCPAGQYYDPINIQCVWSSTSSCVANSPCLLAPNGFISNGKTCPGYIRCGSSREVSSGSCPDGRYFNPNNGMCDYPENVDCPYSKTKPPVVTDPVAPANLCQKDNFFYSDSTTCRGYFYCAKSGGSATWGQCPKNSDFDEANQKCVDPDQVVCTYDRCDGSKNAFMAVANTKCKSYYSCSNGVETGTGSCPADHPYFDELSGACQSNVLTYPICS